MTLNETGWHLESGRLILPRAIKNGRGEFYDISIGLSSNGKHMDASCQGPDQIKRIEDIVKGCLESLRNKMNRDNLEELGFMVEAGAAGANPKTAALVAKVGGSVLQSLQKGEMDELTSIDAKTLIVGNETVEEKLLELGSLLTSDSVTATATRTSPTTKPTRAAVSEPPSSEPLTDEQRINQKKVKLLKEALTNFQTAYSKSRWFPSVRIKTAWENITLEQLQNPKEDFKGKDTIKKAFDSRAPELQQLFAEFEKIAPQFYEDTFDRDPDFWNLVSDKNANAVLLINDEIMQELENRWKEIVIN